MQQHLFRVMTSICLSALLVSCDQNPATNSPSNPTPPAAAAPAKIEADTGANVPGAEPTPAMSQRELMQRMAENDVMLILDVREPDEYSSAHLPGAINIPHTEILARIDELPGDRGNEIIVHCQSGRRAAIARATLKNEGYTNVRELSGHFAEWSARDLPLERDPAP